MSFILPYLDFIGVIIVGLIAAGVPFFLMRLQAKKLKADIARINQAIENSKVTSVKDQTTALETLERVANTTADELEKSLQKSVTIRNLLEQIGLQKTQIEQQKQIIDQLTTDVSSEKAARLEYEGQFADLQKQLVAERCERQTAVAEIETLKLYSDGVIKRLTARVKRLEDYIQKNDLPVPNEVQDNEEDQKE